MMRMSQPVKLIAVAAIGMLVSSWAFAALTITLASKAGSAVQGGMLSYTFISPEQLPKGAKLKLGNNAAPLYLNGMLNKQWQYETFVGLPIDATVGKNKLSVVSADGTVLAELGEEQVKAVNFQKQFLQVSKATQGLQPVAGEMEAIGALKNVKSAHKYWVGNFVSPTGDCQNSPFGVKRYYNGKYSGNYHKGVDLRSPMARPVRAIEAGKIMIGTTKFRLHGGTVGIDHGHGVSSVYIHLSKVLVNPGDEVSAGQVIGLVGSTGFATGPHLHWGLYVNGAPVDPNHWVPFKTCGN